MEYNKKKAKCKGCVALINEGGVFSCKLGYGIEAPNGVSPKPQGKCYKPLNQKEYKKAEELTNRRNAKKSNDTHNAE